jgi:hypothetical protein
VAFHLFPHNGERAQVLRALCEAITAVAIITVIPLLAGAPPALIQTIAGFAIGGGLAWLLTHVRK